MYKINEVSNLTKESLDEVNFLFFPSDTTGAANMQMYTERIHALILANFYKLSCPVKSHLSLILSSTVLFVCHVIRLHVRCRLRD